MKQDCFAHCRMWPLLLTLCFFISSQNAFTQYQTSQVVKTPNPAVYSEITGYLESLPVDYDSNATKKYPLIIFWHGADEKGDVTGDNVSAVAKNGLPKYIKDGLFPSHFTVGNETFSFIVLSPQIHSTQNNVVSASAMLQYAISNYRVDTTRVYFTGLSLGGRISWNRVSSSDSMSRKIAGEVLVCPGSIVNLNTAAHVIKPAAANLPIWTLSNFDDQYVDHEILDTLSYNYNAYTPAPSPLMKLTYFTGTEQPSDAIKHDAWTRAYNPTTKIDGLNIYEWMLQYTNKKLRAVAGADQSFTSTPASVILDGTKSHARGGRIINYTWTKIAGPSGGTITNANDSTTSITSLSNGMYSYKLAVEHTDNTFAYDTVNITVEDTVQALNKITTPVSTYCGGYLESLPADYSANPMKNYPVIISLHTNEELGDGSQAALDTLKHKGIPRYINDGGFPNSFTVNGEQYSFIVIAPQISSTVSSPATVQDILNYVKTNYRVDTTRIYLTGLRLGGRMAWQSISLSQPFTNSIAALTLIAPNSISGLTGNISIPAGSSLPLWILQNVQDPSAPYQRADTLVNNYNSYSPVPSPLAKLTLFTGSEQPTNKLDAWTRSFDPSFKENGLNIYEWMLQYTNEKLAANAGPDQAITLPLTSITLDGRKSHSRQGQITNYAWTKLSGPSGGIITSPSNDTTIVTSLAAGTYVFELQITHTDASTDKDTVIVSTQTQTAVSNPSPEIISTIGGYYESLPVNYNEDTTKRFPLLMFLHANAEMGNGTTELPELLVSGPPKLLNEGKFPATVILGGQQFSFIVVSPQLKNSSSVVSAAKAMIDYAVNKYRVDTNRIYITGIGLGGLASWRFAGYSLEYADRLAACLLVRPNIDTLTGSSSNPTPIIAYNSVGGSDLPFWVTHASGDNVAAPWKATALVDSVNSRNPDPLAKLTMFSTASGIVDAWTKTYDPASKFWSDSINVYQWMLSYQRSITSPRKANPSATPVLQVQSESSDEEMLNAKISPNPVNAQIKVLITGKAKGRSSLTLYTLQGQRLSQQLFNKENENPVSRIVRTSNLPAGYYSIFVTIGRHQKVVKFIKQ